METTNNPANNKFQKHSQKKEWKEPTLVVISHADVEKNVLTTKETAATGKFTPIAQYHS
jgi:hypothetical protein